ncbi:MAG: hypothetical protein ACK4OO_01670 [bacterium]
MDIEGAILSAIEYENRVYGHYLIASQKLADPTAERIFGVLASEERGHIAYLEDRLKEWQEKGTIDPVILTSILPNSQWLQEGKVPMKKISLEKDYENELQMLKDALRLEREVSDHYRRLVAALPDPARGMFSRFLEIEEGHTALVQAEIDALQKDGFWFDISEFNLEAG